MNSFCPQFIHAITISAASAFTTPEPRAVGIKDCSGTYRPGMFHTIDDSFARQNRQPGGRSPFLFLGILQQGILAWNTYNSLNFPLLGEPC